MRSGYVIDKEILGEEVVLEKIKFYCERQLDLKHLSNTHFNYYINKDIDRLIFTLETEILGRRFYPKEIKYPINWLEAIKERFFTKFLLRKWPVKYKIVNIEFQVLYPDLNVRIPEHEHFLRVLVNETVI